MKEKHFKIYFPKKNSSIYLITDATDWKLKDEYKFQERYPYYELEISIDHKTSYLLNIDEKVFRDPNSVFFDNEFNSVFWDFDESRYKQKYDFVFDPDKSLKILQTDLPGLIWHFRNGKGQLGHEVKRKDFYKFVADSGVIEKIKELGFNAIQFLPITKSIDGDNWKFRYLSPFPKALEDKWGDPDDFAQMIDAFHEQGIAFIQDVILSHSPFKNFKINGFNAADSSLPAFYLGDETTWGTKRYKYSDPYIQDYLIDSVLHFMKNFHIDGFRVDNVDGILRLGDNGDGKDRPGGRDFLQKVNKAVYSVNPKALVNYEAHFFKDDNAKMLIAKLGSNKKALGATSYTSSRETYFFQTEYMPKGADAINPSRIKEIIDEKEWGESNSCVADFHNHDAASGLMEMRATGSYAYHAITLGNNHLHHHAVGKIKVMEAIVSLCLEGRSLDLLQTFLMQNGSFEHDTSIEWYLEMIEANRNLLNYKKKINEIMDHEDFWPKNIKKRNVLEFSNENKTIVFEKGKHIVCINMGAEIIFNFGVSVSGKSKYEVILNSDEFQYCGEGRVNIPNILETKPGPKVKFDMPPYGVIILRKKLSS